MRPAIRSTTRALLLATLALGISGPTQAAGDAAIETAEDVERCMRSNAPEQTSQLRVEFTTTDRVGSERSTRATILHKRFDDGLRRVVLRFSKPNDLRDASFLMAETPDGGNDMFLYTPELRRAKRLSGQTAKANLFGMDFSAEDLERWWSFQQPGKSTRLPDGIVADRPVYVIVMTPGADVSTYQKIVSHVDQATCVALRVESFEPGGRLRKVLTADPAAILESSGRHVATELVQEDLVDETHTRVEIEDVEFDLPIKDRKFMVSSLARG